MRLSTSMKAPRMSNEPADESPQLAWSLLDCVPSMLAHFDADLICRFANAAYVRGLGVDPAKVVGVSMAQILGSERFARREAHVRRALAGHVESFEDAGRAADGAPLHLQITYVPERIGGAVQGFAVEITDITVLRLTEVALRDSEAKFRTLSESSPLGVYFADAHGKRTYTNARWQEIYGLSSGQGLGDGWTRVLHEDDRDRVIAAWRDMAAKERELELEFRIRRHDAAVRILRTRARPVRNDAGDMIGFVGAIEDITERKADESRLRASEEFLDRTGRIAGVGGWQVDLLGGEVHWSAHTRRIHEVDEHFQPSLGRGLEFYPPDARARLDAAIKSALSDGTSWDLELPFITAGGRDLWVRVFGEVEHVEGVPVRLLGAFQDVTEYRRHRVALLREQELRLESERHAAELDRLLTERGEMLDVLAHEVRQPLNNASAALQSAASAVDELHEQSASVRLVRAQTVLGQVLASIDNTLAVASLLARPGPLRRQDADIDTLLAVSIGDMLPGERARIRVERDTRTRTASMDMSLMRLALRNLLSNALRYSPPGSPVVVRVGDWDEPLALVLDVSNAGAEIPAERVQRLFERGAKRRANDASHPAGLGLGLYIVRRVMELHAGSAELAANSTTGVTFRLVLTQQADE
jgi:PAS domain S-box-containing protein